MPNRDGSPPKATPKRLSKWRCFDAQGISARPTILYCLEGTGDDGQLYKSGPVAEIATKNRRKVRTTLGEVILLLEPSSRYVEAMDASSEEIDWDRPFDTPAAAMAALLESAAPAPQSAAPPPRQWPWTGLLTRLAARLQPKPKSATPTAKVSGAPSQPAASTTAATKKARMPGTPLRSPSKPPAREARPPTSWP